MVAQAVVVAKSARWCIGPDENCGVWWRSTTGQKGEKELSVATGDHGGLWVAREWTEEGLVAGGNAGIVGRGHCSCGCRIMYDAAYATVAVAVVVASNAGTQTGEGGRALGAVLSWDVVGRGGWAAP